jgi:hypothetical protein
VTTSPRRPAAAGWDQKGAAAAGGPSPHHADDGEPDLVEYEALAATPIPRGGATSMLAKGARLRVARNDWQVNRGALARLVRDGRLRPVAAWRRHERVDLLPPDLLGSWPD